MLLMPLMRSTPPFWMPARPRPFWIAGPTPPFWMPPVPSVLDARLLRDPTDGGPGFSIGMMRILRLTAQDDGVLQG